METTLADYLTIDPDAQSMINSKTELYIGPSHEVESIDSFPSVSDVINESSGHTGVSVPPEKKAAFDKAWREQMRRCFDAEGPEIAKQLDEYESTGMSNGRKLRLTVMVLSPGKYFKIHAHPNIEFEYTMLGCLREFRWLFTVPADELRGDGKQLTGPEIAATHMFEEKASPQNHCMLNETGSVHQSFTSDQACVLLVLWSGCHANTHPSCVFNSDSRLRPSAGW